MTLPLIPIFVLGSFWFWLLVAITLLVILCDTSSDDCGFSAFALFVSVVLFTLFGSGGILTAIALHPLTILSGLGIYLVIGTIWGVCKWYLFVSRMALDYDNLKRKWLQSCGMADPGPNAAVPPVRLQDWCEYATSRTTFISASRGENNARTFTIKVPSLFNYSSQWISWVAYWPISMFWSAFHDMLLQMFERLRNLMSGLTQRIANFVFRRILADFQQSPTVDNNDNNDKDES